MARKKAKLEEASASVPLSAMIDVVFLLLIYFIFTQKPIIEDTQMFVELPSPNPSTTQNQEEKPMLRIGVNQSPQDNFDLLDRRLQALPANDRVGRDAVLAEEKCFYQVNDGWWEYTQLKSYLEDVAKSSTDTTLLISCGPNARHRKLMRLLDLCNHLKLKDFKLLEDDSVPFVKEPLPTSGQ